MEVITKYKAKDGKEFSVENECVKYEGLIDSVNEITKPLGDVPENKSCSFTNGEGFRQHKSTIVRSVTVALLEKSKEYIDHHWIQQTIDSEKIDLSWCARVFGDHGLSPLNSAMYRLQCIDGLGREFGQPYYVKNPSEATLVSI